MKSHVKFVAIGEIRSKIRRPLIGLGEQHSAGELFVESLSKILKNGVSLRQILTIRSFPLRKIGNRVQPEAIDSRFQPELHYAPHFFSNRWVVVVEVRLVTEKAVPVVGLRNRVP